MNKNNTTQYTYSITVLRPAIILQGVIRQDLQNLLLADNIPQTNTVTYFPSHLMENAVHYRTSPTIYVPEFLVSILHNSGVVCNGIHRRVVNASSSIIHTSFKFSLSCDLL